MLSTSLWISFPARAFASLMNKAEAGGFIVAADRYEATVRPNSTSQSQ